MTHSTPAPAGDDPRILKRAKWQLALSRMKEALQLLDESDASVHIGAQLDLAIQQLADEIARSQDAN